MRHWQSAIRRWRQWRWRERTSAPYLSGDAFRSLADVAMDAGRPDLYRHFAAGFRQARSIFVKTDLLPQFLEQFSADARACRVLITGNSDLEIADPPHGLPPALRVWFAQNALRPAGVIRVLPIGVENLALGVNGVPSYFRCCTNDELAAKRLRVLAAFTGTTPERSRLLDLLGTADHVDRLEMRLAPKVFQARLRSYRFVLAPRGNGLDTHRFWEALYADAIPIVRRSAWSTALRDDGIPLIEVGEWEEMAGWTHDDLAQRSASLPASPSALSILRLPFWQARLAGLTSAGADAQTS